MALVLLSWRNTRGEPWPASALLCRRGRLWLVSRRASGGTATQPPAAAAAAGPIGDPPGVLLRLTPLLPAELDGGPLVVGRPLVSARFSAPLALLQDDRLSQLVLTWQAPPFSGSPPCGAAAPSVAATASAARRRLLAIM
ncbi:hypothetical protein D9Q98_007693 [Chlorella vulgaris]|uniref:Uncharacterized protein n=1 Tax=Chlorella vulgaris TaxID=3077 RepID=A0A9D4YTW7_CHLVU|nr:hypothetical protein D9Q98_007693 [Chlorella vulgaris]